MPFMVAAALILGLASMAESETPELAHTRAEFRVTVHLPYAQAAPLFGAWAEQKWAPDWKPQFIYPTPAVDQEGAVFKVEHGSHASIWVTTVFDLPGGHVQYVYILNQLLITRIDIRMRKEDSMQTGVSVVYERTALDPAANAHVQALAKIDSTQAAEWQTALDKYAARVSNE